jgi:iron complex outermembrane receptor protein
MVMSGDTFTSIKFANVFNQDVWNNIGLFGEYQSRFGQVDFSAALRVDYNQANSADTFRLVRDGVAWFDQLNSEYLNFSFSTGIKKRLVRELYLTAALGLGTRSPSILERFVKLLTVQFDSYDYLGNPQLKPEQNWQADISFDYYLPGIGSFYANGFISMVNNYILGKIIPPSVIKPSTQGVLGVKQFSNVDQVYLTGFEFTYQSPSQFKWGAVATAGATFGTNPSAVKYLITNGQVTGEETIYNDPLPEIPPLEGAITLSYTFFKSKLIPRIKVRMVSEQNRVSQAYDELKTPGFVTAAFSLSYNPFNFVSVSAGVENMLNNPYYEHLNRRIVGSTEKLYEPGRVYYINLMLQF